MAKNNDEEKVIHMRKAADFAALRKLIKGKEETVIIALDDDIDLKKIDFIPIDAVNKNIIIQGNHHKLLNLNIKKAIDPETGMFSVVKSLEVYNLNLLSFDIKGEVCTGALAGTVRENAVISNSIFNGNVEGVAYTGGLVGTVRDLRVEKSYVKSNVKGKEIIGGLAGTVNSLIGFFSTFDTDVESNGRTVGKLCGYNNSKERMFVEYMLKVAEEHLSPVVTYDDEMASINERGKSRIRR